MLYYIEIHLKSLQHNVHSKPPVSLRHSAALYCTVSPRTVPVQLLGSFVSIYMTETGTVVGCLLGNIVVLPFSECTAADIN
jgi:hypothetical protein